MNRLAASFATGWTAEPMVSSGIVVRTKVDAEAALAEIEELIRHANRVSTASNPVRQGTAVSLGNIQAVFTAS